MISKIDSLARLDRFLQPVPVNAIEPGHVDYFQVKAPLTQDFGG